jgi:hypothetical protein
MASPPAIDVAVAASPAVFDIDGPTDLNIHLSLTLNHDRPITLSRVYASLFDGKILHHPGLTFTNVETGQCVPRNRLDICYFASTRLSWTTRRSYVTLYPGKQHVIHTSFAPRRAGRRDGKHPAAWFVESLRFDGFKDGQTYHIGISEEALVRNWFKGTFWEMLAWQTLGWAPRTMCTNIRYKVVESSAFTIKRPEEEDIRLRDLLAVSRTHSQSKMVHEKSAGTAGCS